LLSVKKQCVARLVFSLFQHGFQHVLMQLERISPGVF